MITLKIGSSAIELIKLCYTADRPFMLIGPHGIGKSELLEQAATAMEIKHITCDLSLMEPSDLIGLPNRNGKTTKFLPPAFLPTDGKGILVFEELNRCERYMRAPCLQLLTARRLNEYRLPQGWLPVAAINPPEGKYEVFDLDEALQDRFVRVRVMPDPDEWLKWARKAGVHPEVIKYVTQDPSVFESPGSNPRAWKSVSDILIAAQATGAVASTVRAAVVGLVGDKRGAAFLKAMNSREQPLNAKLVLTSYEQYRPRIHEWIAGNRLDNVRATLLAVNKFLQPEQKYEEVRNDAQQWSNLGRFLHDLPGDLRDEAGRYFTERRYDFPQISAKR